MKPSGLLFHAFAHAVAAGVVVSLCVGVTVVAYFGLLAWAVIAGSPIGSPLALLGMMAMAFLGSLLAVIVVLFPVTILAELVCRRVIQSSRFLQIPVATVLCLLEVLTIGFLVAWLRSGDPVVALTAGFVAWLLLLVPLGVYWWILQAHQGAKWLALRVWARIRGSEATT